MGAKMHTTQTTGKPSFETVWAVLQENAQEMKEFRRSMKELRESQKETTRQMKKMQEEIENIFKKKAEEQTENVKREKNLTYKWRNSIRNSVFLTVISAKSMNRRSMSY